ncbi:hypothetical protein LT493_02880 [Streptomyces tricolor]|nr:hypothetical protein [Streptomyces tricolor]
MTVRTLRRSGPYALPRSLRPPASRSGDPDLTYFAALDRTLLRLAAGRLPRRTDGAVEVALPRGRRPGAAARARRPAHPREPAGGPAVRVRIVGVYRPASVTAPYWRPGRPARPRGEGESGSRRSRPCSPTRRAHRGAGVWHGATAWLASADFASVTTGRIGALRTAARDGGAALRAAPALRGTTVAQTALARRAGPGGPLAARDTLHPC